MRPHLDAIFSCNNVKHNHTFRPCLLFQDVQMENSLLKMRTLKVSILGMSNINISLSSLCVKISCIKELQSDSLHRYFQFKPNSL